MYKFFFLCICLFIVKNGNESEDFNEDCAISFIIFFIQSNKALMKNVPHLTRKLVKQNMQTLKGKKSFYLKLYI